MKTKTTSPGALIEESETSVLDSILSKVDVTVPTAPVEIETFTDRSRVGEESKGSVLAAALSVFVSSVAALDRPVQSIDKHLIDSMIAGLDETIGRQVDQVLHHPEFQKVESAWRGLKFLVDRTDFRRNVSIEMLSVTKGELYDSFAEAPELSQSALYKKVYTEAYDTPGADPYAVMIGNYEFDQSARDIKTLAEIAKVSSSAHCPFIASAGARFFGTKSMVEWKRMPDLEAFLTTSDYAKWNSFRESEDSRYIGLTLPRFLLRSPHRRDDEDSRAFAYDESTSDPDNDPFLWGNAAFAFGANLIRAFQTDGWCVQIRGPQAGGTVPDLPVHIPTGQENARLMSPTEISIDETLEFACSRLGFIPMSNYQGRDFACFFSANSVQSPTIYDSEEATANSRINARLPYIFLASRIAHYLKVLQRENIGATKDRKRIEDELNAWLSGLVTEMPNPAPEQIAKYPLRAATVRVHEVAGNPGFFRVETAIMPHFQIEGMDISLSLVGKMPAGQ